MPHFNPLKCTTVFPDGHNGGLSGVVADGGTIAHGLGNVPAFALVQTTVASEFASITALDANNITVAIKKDTGAAGTAQALYWFAACH